jgi:hypothetical protein
MALFLDMHHYIDGLTKEGIEKAHQMDLEVEGKYGVKHLKYWFDEKTGKAFCLIQAPDKETALRVHKESHGLVADEIIEVQEGH